MGVDRYVRLVVGFKVSYREQEDEVIRYDTKTGKPYTKKEKKIICSHGECPKDLEEFMFGYAQDGEEYDCVRGKSLYCSKSHRNIFDNFEMMIPVCPEKISSEIQYFRKIYPTQDIKAYIFPDENW